MQRSEWDGQADGPDASLPGCTNHRTARRDEPTYAADVTPLRYRVRIREARGGLHELPVHGRLTDATHQRVEGARDKQPRHTREDQRRPLGIQ